MPWTTPLPRVGPLYYLIGVIGSHHSFSPGRAGEKLWTVTIIPMSLASTVCGLAAAALLIGVALSIPAFGERFVAP